MKFILIIVALFNFPNALTKMLSIEKVELDIDPKYGTVNSNSNSNFY